MKPVLQALVLAERIYEDKSGKKIIAGTFNGILLERLANEMEQQVPNGEKETNVRGGGTDPGRPSAYISLTDIVDGTEITLQFVNVSKNKVLSQSPGIKINCTDRLATIELVAPLLRLSQCVQEPGTFSLDVVWNGEILGSHRIIAREKTRPARGD